MQENKVEIRVGIGKEGKRVRRAKVRLVKDPIDDLKE